MGRITPQIRFWQPDYDFQWAGTAAAAADPQLQFFENFPGHLGATFASGSDHTLSIHAVNIPLSLSFNYPAILLAGQYNQTSTTGTFTWRFGLYSLNGATLSLANSASASSAWNSVTFTSWLTFATSATQNITPGTWYLALQASRGGGAITRSHFINSSINPANAIPGGFLMGRMTVSTAAMPASIATSELDITGSDAIRQPYIIITA